MTAPESVESPQVGANTTRAVRNVVVWLVCTAVSVGLLGASGLASYVYSEMLAVLLAMLGLLGLAATVVAWPFVVGILVAAAVRNENQRARLKSVAVRFVPASLLLAAVPVVGAGWWLEPIVSAALGGAWGRPLRVAGRQLHPELRVGSDWTRGERPGRDHVSDASAAALEALWLHDAQKEHASVPAFSRVAWMLAAVGAPAELLRRCHVAGLEEIDHAERCFALAAGYGGRSHTVEPMPDLTLGGLQIAEGQRPLDVLAVESVRDGCLLEDFNADVARRCHAVCTEPATREVLRRITAEERSHAEFSWDVVAWALESGDAGVRRAVAKAFADLGTVSRPTATTPHTQTLVQAADANELRTHGRIPDAEWEDAWNQRLTATLERGRTLLDAHASVRVGSALDSA